MENSVGGLIILALIAFSIFLYFIPSFLAYKYEKENRFVILLINLFFGGTGLGWLVALALALSGNKDQSKSARRKK